MHAHKNRSTTSLPSSTWVPPAPDSVWTLTLSHSNGSRGEEGDSRGFDFTWRRSCKARSADKSPGCGGCLWVRVGHGSPSQPNPPSVSCLLLFLSSIHLSFEKRGRSERNNGLVLPPLSSQQWGCIQNRGHGEPKGILLLLSLFSSSQCFHLPLPILTLRPPPHPPSH